MRKSESGLEAFRTLPSTESSSEKGLPSTPEPEQPKPQSQKADANINVVAAIPTPEQAEKPKSSEAGGGPKAAGSTMAPAQACAVPQNDSPSRANGAGKAESSAKADSSGSWDESIGDEAENMASRVNARQPLNREIDLIDDRANREIPLDDFVGEMFTISTHQIAALFSRFGFHKVGVREYSGAESGFSLFSGQNELFRAGIWEDGERDVFAVTDDFDVTNLHRALQKAMEYVPLPPGFMELLGGQGQL